MIVGAPSERFAIDLCGPFPSSNGYKYLFTAICVFSKFGICVPVRNKEASTVARALVDHVFLKYGLCSEILTDFGLEFQNELMQELLSIFGVAHLRTSGYRPQTNGVCEVWHRTLNAMIAKLVDEGQRDWSSLVPYVTFCYNATEHTATGFSPFFIFTGRTPLWTVDLVLPELDRECRTVPEYATAVVDRWKRRQRWLERTYAKRLPAPVTGIIIRPGPNRSLRGTMFEFITPEDILAGHQNGSSSIGLRVVCLKSSTMPFML